ncbi:hypothetical protein AGDE_08408 [Angomonas deanei]|uniref:DUF7623 domain-containing protein n=1 Tax=Angomonas deanei TaxID=59799 RepID=A0A7G2CPY5_9TRYP|nr:hypothetical protein AGDE_08408 [Angomonas deanei]CAD2221916.1 hypothetical protein, conserved [Angomonas deanei]|eukprot:EPY32988.1 hypothetical protein AGDE_08408 [Angomonas deanei]
MRLAAQREDVVGPLRRKLESVKKKEEEIKNKCAGQMAEYVGRENALRTKLRFVDVRALPVPLQSIKFETNPSYNKLMESYERLLSDPERTNSSKKKRLEKQISDIVQSLAEGEATWQQSQFLEAESLNDRYTFLPLEPVMGIRLSELGATNDPEFRTLAHTLDEARKDPPNFEAIEEAEKKLKEYVMKKAEGKNEEIKKRRKRCPRLPRRVHGILVSDVPLPEGSDIVESEENMLKYYDAKGRQIKDVLVWRADDNEAVRARNPFLEYNDVRNVPLRELNLQDDSTYRSYLKKWLQSLAKDSVDRDTVRIYEDLLRECAEELASDSVVKEEQFLGDVKSVAGEVPRTVVTRDVRDLLGREVQPTDADVLKRMCGTYEDAECDVAKEFADLHDAFPVCIRDINPAAKDDEHLKNLEAERLQQLKKVPQKEVMESIEREEMKRSVELLNDSKYVEDAAKACADSDGIHPEDMTIDQLNARWKHRLKERHHRNRMVSFADIPEIKGERKRSATAAKRTRDRKKRNTSWSNLEIAAVPDNVFTEIREDERRTSLPGSEAMSDSQVVSDGGKRRQRSNKKRSQGVVSSVPDNIAYQVNEDGSMMLLGSSVNSSVPLSDAKREETGADPTTDEEPKKKKKRVLKKRVKVKRTSITSHLSISAIPDMEVGELYEKNLDNLEGEENKQRVPTKPAGQPNRAPRKPATRRQKSNSNVQAVDEPDVTKKTRKRGMSKHNSMTLTATGEAPEVSVGPLQPSKGDDPALPLGSDQAVSEPASRATSRGTSRKKRGQSARRKNNISISNIEMDEHGELKEDNVLLDDAAARTTRRPVKPAQPPKKRRTMNASATSIQMDDGNARIKDDIGGSLEPARKKRDVEESPDHLTRRYVTARIEATKHTNKRVVKPEEVEADETAMDLINERFDLLKHASASRTPEGTPLLKARVADIDTAVEEIVQKLSQKPAEGDLEAKVAENRKRREQAAAQASTATLHNPRCTPMRWSYLNDEEISQDDTAQELLQSGTIKDDKVLSYMTNWSLRKEAANEALFARYPFLPALPSGLSLIEVGFTDDKEFQKLARDNYKSSPNLQLQMRTIVENIAKTKVAAEEGRKPNRYVDRVRATVGETRPEADAKSEDPNQALFEAIRAARANKGSKFLDERQRLAFVNQSKQESEKLIKRMIVRMKRDKTSDIPLSVEDVDKLRFFFDGVDVDHFGVLDRMDYTDYVMLTVAEGRQMRRTDVEKLTFPDATGALPKLVDFSDFSKFYQAVALRELAKQDPSFDTKRVDQTGLQRTASVPRSNPTPRGTSGSSPAPTERRPSSFNVRPTPPPRPTRGSANTKGSNPTTNNYVK